MTASKVPVSDMPGDLRDVTATLADLVEEAPAVVEASENLFELGLDSISLMQLVARWRRAGVEVDFAELAERPTVADWTQLIAARRAAAESRARSQARAVGEHAVPAGFSEIAVGVDGDSEEFDLAPLQHAYWIGRGDDRRLGGVAAHLYSEFDGSDVDAGRLAAALDRLVERHEMLRVRITDTGRQVITGDSGWRGLTVRDLRDSLPTEADRVLAEVRDEYSHQLLDIEAGEVLSTALTLLPGGRTRFHLDVDMVAADAVSYRVLLADLATLYLTPGGELPPIRGGYRDYLDAVAAEHREDVQRATGYWQSRLAGLPGAPELPMARDHPVAGRPEVTREYVLLGSEEREALAGAARRRGVTLAAAIATAFAEVLGAWSSKPRFLLNVPMFDREQVHPDVDLLVGDFTSSVLLAVDLTEPRTFADRVREIQAQLHTDAANADHCGVEVLRELSRRDGEQVLAPVVFTSALNLGELFSAEVGSAFGDAVWIISQCPQVLLDAQVTEVSGGLLVNWDVRSREFSDGVVSAMFRAFVALLRRLAAQQLAWVAPLGDLSDPALLPPRRVPRSRAERVPAERVAPRDDLERAIALLWTEALGLSDSDLPGVAADFFVSGGDSLSATVLVRGLREVLVTQVATVRMLFAAPTIDALAARLRAAEPLQGRLDEAAALFCKIATMSEDEVAGALEARLTG